MFRKKVDIDAILDEMKKRNEEFWEKFQLEQMRGQLDDLNHQIYQAQINSLQNQIDDLKNNCPNCNQDKPDYPDDIIDVVPIEISSDRHAKTAMVKRP